MRKRRTTLLPTGNEPAFVFGAFVYILFGPIVWAGHLLFVYGPQSAICAFGVGSDALVEAQVLGVTGISLAAVLLGLAFPRALARLLRLRTGEEELAFALSLMRLLSVLSLAGIAWAGATPLLIDPCASLR